MAAGDIIIVTGGQICLYNGKIVIDDGSRPTTPTKIPFDDFEEWTLTVVMRRDRSRISRNVYDLHPETDDPVYSETVDLITEYENFYPLDANLTYDRECESQTIDVHETSSGRKTDATGSASVSARIIGCKRKRTDRYGNIILEIVVLVEKECTYEESVVNVSLGGILEESHSATESSRILLYGTVTFYDPQYDDDGNLIPQDGFVSVPGRQFVGTNGQTAFDDIGFIAGFESIQLENINSSDIFR